jgi:4-aminobutyrate aminotransferase-like enzyme
VTEAVAQQLARVNTNTRFLSRDLVTYAQRLLATFATPHHFTRVAFVCSGSSANELALRLAYAVHRAKIADEPTSVAPAAAAAAAATASRANHAPPPPSPPPSLPPPPIGGDGGMPDRRQVLVLEHGYHGNTAQLVALSPYKFRGRGGIAADAPPPRGTVVLPVPDPLGREDPSNRGAAGGQQHPRPASEADGPVVALLAESISGCGGQLVFPEGFLRTTYRDARALGAVVIADEVQTGFGRVGTHFWAFESQGALPDMVTMGKPMGNGFPMGAVAMTEQVARAFCGGMEFFDTFGGCNAAIAAGLAVLDVLRDEALVENAQRVGAHLTAALRELAARHGAIGDVRGPGLFVGIEIVRPGTVERDPATARALQCGLLESWSIIVSLDGPANSVVKIKPPMVFSIEDADLLVRGIDDVLGKIST